MNSRGAQFRRVMTLALAAAVLAACGRVGGQPSGTAPSSAVSATPPATATPAATTVPAPVATAAETPTPRSSDHPSADPALEAMLPGAVDGTVLGRMSVPGAGSGGSGDMCFVFCPGEPEYFALALHRTSLDGTYVAVAGADQADIPVVIYAFRVPGARTEDLAPAWVTAEYRAVADPMGGNLPTPDPSATPAPTLTPFQTGQAQIGGKQVTILYDSSASDFDPKALQYLYARDDILFIVESPKFVLSGEGGILYQVDDPTNPPAAVVDSLAALP